MISKYYGESEQRLREVFEEANENAPSIIFIDELDSIAPKREDVTGEVERRVVAQLLTMMDGLEERGEVVVIGATNRLDAIDPALRRPGRFDREIEIGVPPKVDRQEILNIHTRGMPIDESVRIDLIAEQTHGFVGADLAALAREAAIRALRRYIPEIDLDQDSIPQEVLDELRVKSDDFREAQREVFPSAMREVMLEGTTSAGQMLVVLDQHARRSGKPSSCHSPTGRSLKSSGSDPQKGFSCMDRQERARP